MNLKPLQIHNKWEYMHKLSYLNKLTLYKKTLKNYFCSIYLPTELAKTRSSNATDFSNLWGVGAKSCCFFLIVCLSLHIAEITFKIESNL